MTSALPRHFCSPVVDLGAEGTPSLTCSVQVCCHLHWISPVLLLFKVLHFFPAVLLLLASFWSSFWGPFLGGFHCKAAPDLPFFSIWTRWSCNCLMNMHEAARNDAFNFSIGIHLFPLYCNLVLLFNLCYTWSNCNRTKDRLDFFSFLSLSLPSPLFFSGFVFLLLSLQPCFTCWFCSWTAVWSASLYEAILWTLFFLSSSRTYQRHPCGPEKLCNARTRAHHCCL